MVKLEEVFVEYAARKIGHMEAKNMLTKFKKFLKDMYQYMMKLVKKE